MLFTAQETQKKPRVCNQGLIVASFQRNERGGKPEQEYKTSCLEADWRISEEIISVSA